MIYLDTESCGLIGPAILIQYAEDDGPIILHEVWYESVRSTLQLIQRMCRDYVCGFNLTHDWFHINKLYNVLSCVSDRSKPPIIDEIADISITKPTTWCIKPKSCLDLFLYIRKGPFQSLMDRDDIIIKKVPTELAKPLADHLQQKLKIPWIYFARGTEGYKWKAELIENEPRFSNIVLRFKPSSALKVVASELFKQVFIDYPLSKSLMPEEHHYDPYESLSWKYLINRHIRFWHENKTARSYAEQDVILLQRLYHYFNDPPIGDDDSVLACCVGACRWHGFNLDLIKIKERIDKKIEILNKPTVNIHSHQEVKHYLKSLATEAEKLCIINTTANLLRQIGQWDTSLGKAANIIYEARKAKKEIDILSKLLDVGRYCPEFKIIGTKSGRMSGGSELGFSKGSINPQGIPRSKEYRSLFTLKGNNTILSGGDFKSFEVVIADAVYKDSNLHRDLQTGKSFHGLFGQALYDISYNEIMSSAGTVADFYTPSKSSTFGLIYGAHSSKIAQTANISEEKAESGFKKFFEQYPGIHKARMHITKAFCSMQQPGGIGTPIIWKEPPEYISSLLGFKRYFTLENIIVRTLFELGQYPPDSFNISGIIRRTDRDQTPRGALQSALFACAFQMQARNTRAAINHVIQSTGAQITKALQCRIWTRQPEGINEWRILPLNIHDEIPCVHIKEESRSIVWLVQQFIEEYRKIVPLLEINWKVDVDNWSEIK